MPKRLNRRSDPAPPTHAKDAEAPSAHARRVGPAHSRADGGTSELPSWLVPLAAVAVAAVCVFAIAVPVALVSGGSEPDPALSAEVREATVVDAPAQGAEDTEVELTQGSLAYGTRLAGAADALAGASVALDQATRDIQASGHEVGYCVLTTDGQEVVSLNPDRAFYGASSMKGPFVLRAFPEGVPEQYRGLVENAIQWSDNDSYYQLRGDLGYDILADQLDSLGVTGFTPYMSYAWMTPRQLAQLWEMDLAPLSLPGEPGDWLRHTFSATDNSALGALPAGDVVPVASAYSKAGWIESGDLSCTVDAGLITLGDTSGNGEAGPSYIIAVMTDAGEDYDALAKVVNALVSYLYYRAELG